jgi:DNA-binding transcriptional MerR regulator
VKIVIVNLDELCAEVNRVLEARGISVPDGRTASVVTPRNVRYYRTIGLLQPPSRGQGRAVYEQTHVDEIIEIKRAQHEGTSLEQLIDQRKKDAHPIIGPRDFSFNLNLSTAADNESPMLARFVTHSINRSGFSAQPRETNEQFGWSVRLGEFMLSGPGETPTQQQINAIQLILHQDD